MRNYVVKVLASWHKKEQQLVREPYPPTFQRNSSLGISLGGVGRGKAVNRAEGGTVRATTGNNVVARVIVEES